MSERLVGVVGLKGRTLWPLMPNLLRASAIKNTSQTYSNVFMSTMPRTFLGNASSKLLTPNLKPKRDYSQLKQNCPKNQRDSSLFNDGHIILAKIRTDMLAMTTIRFKPLVYSPDSERSKWENRVIQQAWPYVLPTVQNFFHDIVDVRVGQALDKYLMIKDFKFYPGQLPPHITVAKVHQQSKTSSDIIMDLNVSYFGDSSIAFHFVDIPGGFKNFEIQGIVRVRLSLNAKPMELQINFLHDPKVDVETSGIAACLGLKYLILSKIRSMMVVPTELTMSSCDSEAVNFWSVSESEGSFFIPMFDVMMPELEIPTCDSDAVAAHRMGVAKLTKNMSTKDPYGILTDAGYRLCNRGRTSIVNELNERGTFGRAQGNIGTSEDGDGKYANRGPVVDAGVISSDVTLNKNLSVLDTWDESDLRKLFDETSTSKARPTDHENKHENVVPYVSVENTFQQNPGVEDVRDESSEDWEEMVDKNNGEAEFDNHFNVIADIVDSVTVNFNNESASCVNVNADIVDSVTVNNVFTYENVDVNRFHAVIGTVGNIVINNYFYNGKVEEIKGFICDVTMNKNLSELDTWDESDLSKLFDETSTSKARPTDLEQED